MENDRFKEFVKVFVAVSVLAFYAALLMGCVGGVSRVPIGYNGERVLVQTTVSDPHALAPTTQRSWIENCRSVIVKRDVSSRPGLEEVEEFEDCHREGDIQFTSATGYVSGLAGPLLYSGAIVGGSALLGSGIRDSADRSTTANTTTNTTNVTIQRRPQPAP